MMVASQVVLDNYRTKYPTIARRLLSRLDQGRRDVFVSITRVPGGYSVVYSRSVIRYQLFEFKYCSFFFSKERDWVQGCF